MVDNIPAQQPPVAQSTVTPTTHVLQEPSLNPDNLLPVEAQKKFERYLGVHGQGLNGQGQGPWLHPAPLQQNV